VGRNIKNVVCENKLLKNGELRMEN